MTPLRQRMVEDMQLRGLSEKTQEAYVRAVRQLAEHYGKSPAQISEEELRQYFLYLKNDKQVSPSTFTVALCGIKFLFQHTLRREWPTLDLVRPHKEKKLPVVLSVGEVRSILGRIRLPRYRVCLSTIYTCGLRLREGIHLQVRDIDSDRMVVHVRHGKRGKDRYVPLPDCTLEMLRRYWSTHRHPEWLFPASTPLGVPPSTATKPMCTEGYNGPSRLRCRRAGFRNERPYTPYVTPMPPICSKPGSICGSFRPTWGTALPRPRPSTLT